MVEINASSLTSLLPACSEPTGWMKLIFDLARTVVIRVIPAVHPHQALRVPAALITFSEPPHPEITQFKPVYS